jgi:tetratricopeptide (TPR) repeat protein
MDALKRLVLHASLSEPVLLVIEDLHWIDTETQAFLDRLVASLPSARVLVLVSYRPEYRHGWGGATGYTELHLDPLPTGSAEELARGLVGHATALQPLRRLLVERTEGNPFFLEESVRTLVATRVLVGERGAYHATQAVDTLQVPPTVRAMLAARIERLPPEEKQVLEAGAVLGKDVPFVLLQAIARVPDATLRDAVAELQTAEFFREAQLSPGVEYTFKHALTHEVAYGTVPADRRRSLHARMVETLEHLYSGRLTEQLERLAHHALRGEVWEKAVAYLRQAGLRAMARGANREAIGHLEALGALRRLPETRAAIELIIDIRIDIRNAALPLGDWARMGDHLHEAEVLARTLGDPHRLARIATFVMHQGLIAGDYAEAVRSGQEVLTIARTHGDRSIEVVATNLLGWTHIAKGELSDAATFLERNVALESDLRYERFGTPVIESAASSAYLADVLSQLGRFDEAIGHAEAAVQIAEAADHPWTLYRGLVALGLVHLRRGDLPAATRVLERYLDLCRTWQIFVGTPLVAAALGAAYALAGRADEALPLVAGAVEEFRRRQWHNWPALILLCAGWPTSRPGGSTRPPATPERRWRSPVGWGLGETRPTPSASQVTSGRQAAPRTLPATTARRFPSPTSSACARSPPTATSALASSTGVQASGSKPRSTSPPRR